ncbi:hypothetical protein [Acidovorax sp. Leaf78]|uniref:hypothetical protein n=1 Tax=Acidovorax sp. Leaf78 TaxID=1736237 RepID=UPI0006F7BE34|nr:hypothetical protein [Acidovorax sp. Leaf78]KQO23536.1 hypothetical protein ASF16_05095 [Acidovorax sp. Leaf78]
MCVLAIFDAEGTWGQTHVCDHLLEHNLQALGVRWGRQYIEAGVQLDIDVLAPLHRLWGTSSVERVRWGAGEGTRPQTPPDALAVHWVLSGTLLVYLQASDGYVGVLCEAGEWISIPAGLACALDAGGTSDVDLLLFLAAVKAPPARQELSTSSLPSHEAFVETMLEMTGYANDE